MKIISPILALITSASLVICLPLYAKNSHKEPTYTFSGTVVGIDANRDKQITQLSLSNGQDTLIAREISPKDTQNKNSFKARDGKTYVLINSIEELRPLDKAKNGKISLEELRAAPLMLVSARILEGTPTIIAERPLAGSWINITLPTLTNNNAIAEDRNHNLIEIKEIKF